MSEALFTGPANYAQPFSSGLGVKDQQDNELMLRGSGEFRPFHVLEYRSQSLPVSKPVG